MERTDVRQAVTDKYGSIARSVGSGGACGPATCGCGDPISSNLYSAAESGSVPAEAVAVSLGCGNPTALASPEPGDTVLDLGSGGGIDVLLSARRVGPSGRVYGLDMTDEMLELARENQRKAGVSNVEFLKGTIEAIPLPDASVDLIVSNCVINLSADKDAVFREAFRVLRPGGRLAVSDIVTRRDVPADIRSSMELWVGCIAGALHEQDFVRRLEAAGFEEASVEPWREYRLEDARAFLAEAGVEVAGREDQIDGAFASAFIRARKPAASSCCDTTCCP